MDERQMTLTILITESNDAYRGTWSACLYGSKDMDESDSLVFTAIIGYGDTPLEAAADLLSMAARYAAA